VNEIYQAIPHRPPFLFIDEIVEVSAEHAVTRREIRADEPQFAGHYPGNPIMPGVLLCEAVFQTAAIYLANKSGSNNMNSAGLTPVLARIEQAKFKKMVKPGDVITMEVRFRETVSKFHFLRGKARNQDNQLVLSLSFALALVAEQ